MAYKTILLCLNEIDRVPQLIAAARQLGVKFNAHVSGLYVIPAVQIYLSAGYGAGPDIFDGNRLYFKEQLSKVQAAFEIAMKQDKISFDMRVVDSSHPQIAMEVIANCRSAELIVVSDVNRDNGDNVETDFVEQLVMSAGRPIIVLPYKGEVKLSFDEVVLAWNDSRESARAAFDALPFMQRAKHTQIVTVDPPPDGNIAGALIAEALDRDGVKCEVMSVAADGLSTGDVLMRTANDQGAGLLVLGAYGHTRLTEWIFGGATRSVLKDLKLPVLMSH